MSISDHPDLSAGLAVALACLWSVIVLLSGTAVLAGTNASRRRLIAALKRVRRERYLERFDRHGPEYVLTAQIYRQLALVLFALTIVAMYPPASGLLLKTIEVLVISVAWFLFVGVAIPTAWARYSGETYLAAVLPVLDVLRQVSRPIAAAFHAVDEIVRRLAGAPRELTDPVEQMEQEILDVVSQAEVSGAVDKSEKAMIQSVMVLDETLVGEIMTPRTAMIGIEADTPFAQTHTLVAEVGHSRIPVYEGTMDHVIGVLYAKDLLGVTDPGAFSLRQIMRKAAFVPETKDLASLLREFQANRVHIAIVLDEYGGTAGLVTIEDILEELVGEIADEHDEPPLPPIRRVDGSIAEVDARVRVEDVNEELDIRLPEDESYDTLGGYVFSKLGRIPVPGDSFVEDNVKIEVVQADERRVIRLRVHLLDAVKQA
ncbi:MAG TPA: hemolysin family protein [Phycisphaerae bacterium]|nr:hemolysin family protein [Phycisphaerae bacterium]